MSLESDFMGYLAHHGIPVTDLRGKLPTRKPGYRKIDLDRRRGIVFHHAAGNMSFKDYAKMHLDRWETAGGIAYSVGVTPEGEVALFWDFDVRTYAQGDKKQPGDENAEFIGVLVNGNFSGPHNKGVDGEPTLAQWHAVTTLTRFFVEEAGWLAVGGHFMFGKPACPGQSLEAYVRALQVHLRALETTRREEEMLVDSATLDLQHWRDRQAALNILGFDAGPEDGVPGTRTKRAFKKFQGREDLTVDGIWGPNTEKAMVKKLAQLDPPIAVRKD